MSAMNFADSWRSLAARMLWLNVTGRTAQTLAFATHHTEGRRHDTRVIELVNQWLTVNARVPT